MSKPLSERELLQIQIKTYEFYAGLIDRAVGGTHTAKLPKWDEQRAEEYKQLADQLRARLAELDEQEAAAPATNPSVVEIVSGAAGADEDVSSAEAG
ncbi:MAG TPA: hypothetical protein VF510_17665 [Ktedonobacterales bacterium]